MNPKWYPGYFLGFARGSDPMNEVYFPEYWEALGRKMPSVRENPGIFRQHQEIIERGLGNRNERNAAEFKAAIATYKRAAGEAEAENILRRFENPNLYRKHPSENCKGVTWSCDRARSECPARDDQRCLSLGGLQVSK